VERVIPFEVRALDLSDELVEGECLVGRWPPASRRSLRDVQNVLTEWSQF
jgi:hypothetical protein